MSNSGEIVAQVREIRKVAKEQTSEINRSAMDKIIALHPKLVLVPITQKGNYDIGGEFGDYDFTCHVCQQRRQGVGVIVVPDGAPGLYGVLNGVGIGIDGMPGSDVCLHCAEKIDPSILDVLHEAMYLQECEEPITPEDAIAKAMAEVGAA